MADPELRVTNRREIRQAFNRLDADTKKELQRELRTVAGPVAETARGLLGAIDENSAQGIRPRTSVGVAFVTQTRRRTTGQHPDYAGLIMTRALLPALEQHEDQIVARISHAFDKVAGKFNG